MDQEVKCALPAISYITEFLIIIHAFAKKGFMIISVSSNANLVIFHGNF